MFGNLFGLRRLGLAAHNENPPPAHHGEQPDPALVRSLATGVALATSVDATPAVVVGIYDYAHRYRDKGRRRA